MNPRERQEALEHLEALEDIKAILKLPQGRDLIKYLFKTLDVGKLPDMGEEGLFLHDHLGFLRAGNAIFKLVSEANVQVAGELIAEIEKERQDELYLDKVSE